MGQPCGALGLAILLLGEAIKDLSRGELQARLSQLPQALLWLAVRQVPKEWRNDLRSEWRSELDAIRREKSETPLTGLAHGIFFATGLLVRARIIARAYAGRPQVSAIVWEAIRRRIIRGIPLLVRNRAVRPSTGDPALAAPGGSGSGTIVIRRPVAIAVALALTTGTALTLYAVTPSATKPKPVVSASASAAILGSYLARSAAVRPTIQAAINAVQQCTESPASGEATLQQAINTRQDIVNSLSALSISGIPDVAQLVSMLTGAMQSSITIDKSYQIWMADFANSGSPCGSDPSQDSSYVAGVSASAANAAAKAAFVAIWDPIAPRYGQQAYSITGF
jgi:hypothetical protein